VLLNLVSLRAATIALPINGCTRSATGWAGQKNHTGTNACATGRVFQILFGANRKSLAAKILELTAES